VYNWEKGLRLGGFGRKEKASEVGERKWRWRGSADHQYAGG
jgi:hypothetical protein